MSQGRGSGLGALFARVPPEVAAALERRELELPRPLLGDRGGPHRSRRAGLGSDFRDHRAYVPGDDPRRLDWRAAARQERLVVRRAEAEDALVVSIAIDAGANMSTGTTRSSTGRDSASAKWRHAAGLVATLAILALRRGDPLSAHLGRDGHLEPSLRKPSSRGERAQSLAAALDIPPSGRCPWRDVLASIVAPPSPQHLVVIVSDFLDPAAHEDEDADVAVAEIVEMCGRLRVMGHVPLLLEVLHPDELEFPWRESALLEFHDPTGTRADVLTVGALARDAYLERLTAHRRRLHERCVERGVLHVASPTDEPLGEALRAVLAAIEGVPDPRAMDPRLTLAPGPVTPAQAPARAADGASPTTRVDAEPAR
jgi:uncharacterized protein (DUF58 family)